jgi:manganese-dependent ADP-ribose/CDP-alcohol diphosphatase
MALGDRQRAWLARTLKDAAARNQKAVILSHLLIKRGQASTKHEFYYIRDADETLRIIEEAGCVAACFAGHYHKGGCTAAKGTHYVTLQGMVEAPIGVNAYAVVEVHADRMIVRGRGLAPDRVLALPASPVSVNAGE